MSVLSAHILKATGGSTRRECQSMMVAFGEGRPRSWELLLDATLNDISAASSSVPSTETDVISPLSPAVPREPFPTSDTQETTNRLRQGNLSSTVDGISPLEPNVPWNGNFWSDATTASAVLSLLHKEPPASPSEPAHLGQHTRHNPRITCSVCLEALDLASYPETPIAAGCDHMPIPDTHICTTCLRRSLDVQFSTSRETLLACPLCHAQLSDEEVKRWASATTFLAYDTARTWQVLEEDVEFVICIHPDCGYGQLHAGGLDNPVVICRACGTRTCFNHRTTPWHEGLTCAEYEASIRYPSMINENRIAGLPAVLRVGRPRYREPTSDELLSQRTIHETTRACPECHAATERAGGCKHMRCGMCLREWCWDCGIYWEQGHLSADCSIFPNAQ